MKRRFSIYHLDDRIMKLHVLNLHIIENNPHVIRDVTLSWKVKYILPGKHCDVMVISNVAIFSITWPNTGIAIDITGMSPRDI